MLRDSYLTMLDAAAWFVWKVLLLPALHGAVPILLVFLCTQGDGRHGRYGPPDPSAAVNPVLALHIVMVAIAVWFAFYWIVFTIPAVLGVFDGTIRPSVSPPPLTAE